MLESAHARPSGHFRAQSILLVIPEVLSLRSRILQRVLIRPGGTVGEETGHRSSSRDLDGYSSVAETKSQVIQQLYEFGPYRLDPSERKLLRNHQIVELPPKAFDTLVHMVRNSGHLMEKEELIRTLWPDSFVEEGSLSNNIFLLRKALGEDPQYIEAVPRRGYRFVGAVRCLPDEARGHREEAQFPGSRPAIAAAASPALPFWRRRALGGSRPLCCWL